MKASRLSLGQKFSIAVAIIIGITMFAAAKLIINYQRESLGQNIAASNFAMTRNLAHDAAESLLVFDPLRLDERVNTVQGVAPSVYGMVVDSSGIVVADTERSRLGSSLKQFSPELASALANDRETVREFKYRNEPVKEFSVPVKIGSKVLGLATIGYSKNKIDSVIEERMDSLKKYIYMISAIILLGSIAGAFAVSSFLTKPLRRLKDRMIDVQAGNLDVEVENPRIVRCWERLGCVRKDCPSYGKSRCWAIAGTFCHGVVQGQFAQKIGDCRKCAVYKESCGGDEINELVEVFNQMVKDLKHNLNALEKANQEKSRMERLSALGEMATTVAHETKNPLNSIRLATSYLKKNFEGEILTEFLTIIEEEVLRLNDMTTSFVGFSKPAPLKLKTCDLNAIVKSTVELIRQEATDRNVEVIVLVDEHVPPVQCDFSRMKQALLNLLINAMDASGEGDAITITTEASGALLRISVQDTGKGIQPEEVEKIFKPFYTTKTRGTGLGLAIVDRIVKEHGGRIEVDSAPDRGATFTMELPAHEYTKI